MVSVIPTADAKLFYRRLKRVYDSWDDLIKVDTIVIPVGQGDKIEYCKSTTIQEWLFNMEIPDTLMIFGKDHIFFMATKKKIDFLRPLQERVPAGTNVPKITLLVRSKHDSNKENFDAILDALTKCTTVGVFAKDTFSGEFYDECIDKIFKGSAKFEKQDITAAMAYILAVKEDVELQLIQKACTATETTYSAVLVKELTAIIDKEKKISHKRLSEKLDDAVTKDARKFLTNLDVSLAETCYVPIIQSGGNYNLRFAATSDDENIHYGTIVSNLGVRYKRYCSNISRTLMIDPTKDQENNYEFLLEVADELINRLTDGVLLSDLYQGIVDYVKSKRPEFVDKLTKNFGFVTGIEFREGSLVISPKTQFRAKKNMAFVISIGFSDLVNNSATDSRAKKYALFVSDTVIVNEAGQPANLLTQKKRKFNKTKILIRQDDESEAEEQQSDGGVDVEDPIISETLREGSRRRVMNDRLRTDAPNSDDKRRREHQRELLQQINDAAKKRLSKKSTDVTETRVKKSICAYKSIKDFPRENDISDLKIYVDKQHETVILPIFGVPVPFHISTIKNVSNSVEGDYLYLRINFFFPGSTLEKGSIFPTNEATFLKELTYRSYNIKEQGEVNSPAQNLQDSFVTIKTVQKKYKSRVDEEKELEGVVKQDILQINPNKNNPKLKDLFIRPNIYPRRISGSLEAHKNGFRFISIKNDKVDIMFNNIKHAIYQPCDGEMIILVHFNLKNPIMLNKKRHYDIQFYTEVGEITTDLGKRQHMHDREDLAAEQAERNLRSNLKKAFKTFCDKVEMATSGKIQFDIPLRDLGFYGVPKKSNVLLQPTPNALVNLTDPDPTVITLSEIELVHFERVSFQLKNFDIVIVFKDYSVKPQSIAAVEMNKLEDIKNWLDRCDIAFTSGSSNLNWPAIMKMITGNIEDFFDEQGGWAFLSSDAEDEEGDEDEEEEEDEVYDPSEDDSEEDEEDTDISEAESEDEYDGSEASEDVGSSEESGKDWSELEEEAARADRSNNYEDAGTHRRTNGTAGKRKSYDDGRGGGGKKRR